MPILRSFYVTLRYHTGTAAFGGLVLAFIQFIRYVAAYLQRRMSSLQKDNKAFRILCCAFQCFLACVQKCIEFVSRNSLIWCAMYGTSFCTSTRKAFFTITSNIAQVALVTFLGDIIQRFGQLLITLCAGFSCWLVIDRDPKYGFGGESQLNSVMLPVLVTMFLAWFISAEVLSVYDITVDTILLSFCQDKRLKRYKENYHERSPAAVSGFMKKHKLKDKRMIRQASLSTFY